MAGGDAVRCHNSLRDRVCAFARTAGMRPEKEESGLLPGDPRRRPGDLFFASWPRGLPLAMDFAVSSPQQQSEVQAASVTQLCAATSYEARKLSDRDTASQCRRHGCHLAPMVVESYGGWGQIVQDNFKFLAHARAARTGESVSDISRILYSGLSITLMRANARSLLARVPAGNGWAVKSLDRSRTLLAASV